MVTKDKKVEIVAELVEMLNKTNGFYFIDFKSMPVKKLHEVRNELKKQNIGLRVAKNTLIKRAFNQAEGVEMPVEDFTGNTALVLGYDDPLAPAKILKELIDKNKMPEFKGAIIEGQYFDGSTLKQLAAMPSKPEIIASILGSLNAPISGIVGSINAVMRDLAGVIEEVAKKQANQ